MHRATDTGHVVDHATGRRLKKVVTRSGDLDATTRFFYTGHKIVETRLGTQTTYHQQFIHGTRYIDEIVMIRIKDKGDLYVHQDANWNVIALTDLGGHVVERYVYSPYGQVTVYQETSFGDYDGDGDVDSDDKGAMVNNPPLVGYCYGTTGGACRVLDLDFDGDQDSADETLFDALPQGLARHPSLTATGVHQPFAHQGLLFEPEIGSYQNRARQYLPGAQRFAQRDPAGHAYGMNAYAYGKSNPGNVRDSSGAVPSTATITELSDRIEVKLTLAFWGWGIDDNPGGQWYDRELGALGTWNVPGNEKAQGVFARLGCTASESCGSVCKPVKFNFVPEFLPSAQFVALGCRDSDKFGSENCIELALSLGNATVSVHVREPSDGAVIRTGTPGSDARGGGVAQPHGGDRVWVRSDYLGIPPFDLSTKPNGNDLHVLSHEIGHAMGLDQEDGTGDQPMMASGDWGRIRIVQHREVVGVLNENRAPGTLPAGECNLWNPTALGRPRGRLIRR